MHRLMLLLCMVVIGTASCGENRFVEMAERLRQVPQVGVPAPEYSGVTLDGDSLRLSELRGQVVLVNAWATWCKPCVAEFPVLEQMHRKYGDRGLSLMGISIDRISPERVQGFLAEHDVSFTNLLDRGHHLEEVFGWGKGVPHTLLIDREGVVARYWIGGIDPNDDRKIAALEDVIEELLGGL